MRKKELAVELSKLKVFVNPDFVDEQYPTDSEVAADLIWDIYMRGSLKGAVVIDLGCGTGILGIGALLLGASKCLFVEKDEKAIKLAEKNLHDVEKRLDVLLEGGEFLNYDIEDFCSKGDIVIMNPPFGTVRQHLDRKFLLKAMGSAPKVFSIHKGVTVDFLREFAKDHGWYVGYERVFSMPLKHSMRHHRSKIRRVDVVALGFEKHAE